MSADTKQPRPKRNPGRPRRFTDDADICLLALKVSRQDFDELQKAAMAECRSVADQVRYLIKVYLDGRKA